VQLAGIERTAVSSLSVQSCKDAKPNDARNSSTENSHAIKKRDTCTSILFLVSAMLNQFIVNESGQLACLLQL
jgi:hypothetical protein